MNEPMVRQYTYLLNRFDKNNDLEYDAALDGLLEACDSSTIPTNPEAFVFTIMRRRVKDAKRNSKRKELTTMPQNEAQKVFTYTKPTESGRIKKKFKGTFEQFYTKWLGDNQETDSIRVRARAEREWECLRTMKPKSDIISLDSLAYNNPDSYDGDKNTRTMEEIIPSNESNIENLMIENEDKKALATMDGIQDKLRSVIQPYLSSLEEDATVEEYQLAYGKALLLLASLGNWRQTYSNVSMRRACKLAGISYDRFADIVPSKAAATISKIEQIKQRA